MSNYIRNGRGSQHSGIPFSAWQRHTPQCEARGYVTKRDGKPCTKCRANDATQEVRFYALSVAVFVTRQSVRVNGKPIRFADMATMTREEMKGAEFLCPLTLQWTPVSEGQADRIVPGHAGGRYEPFNLCMVSAGANVAREDETTRMDDDAYSADVHDAAKRVARVLGVHTGVDMPVGYRNAVKGGSTRDGAPDVAGIHSGPYGA